MPPLIGFFALRRTAISCQQLMTPLLQERTSKGHSPRGNKAGSGQAQSVRVPAKHNLLGYHRILSVEFQQHGKQIARVGQIFSRPQEYFHSCYVQIHNHFGKSVLKSNNFDNMMTIMTYFDGHFDILFDNAACMVHIHKRAARFQFV